MRTIVSMVVGMIAIGLSGYMLVMQINKNTTIIKKYQEAAKLSTVTLRDVPKEDVSARIVKPEDVEDTEYMGYVDVKVPTGLYNLHAEVYCADYLQNNAISRLDYFIWIDSGVWHTRSGEELGNSGRGYGAGKDVIGYRGSRSSDVPLRMTQDWINSRANTHPYLLGMNKLTQTGKSQLIVYARQFPITNLVKRARSVFVNTGISCGISNSDGIGYEEDTGGVLKALATLENGKYSQAYPLAKNISPTVLVRTFLYAAKMMSEPAPVFDSIVPVQMARARVHKDSAFEGTLLGLALQKNDETPIKTDSENNTPIDSSAQKEHDTESDIQALTDKVNKLQAQVASQAASTAPKVPVVAPAVEVKSRLSDSQMNQNISGN